MKLKCDGCQRNFDPAEQKVVRGHARRYYRDEVCRDTYEAMLDRINSRRTQQGYVGLMNE
jgi:hypothetical protein